MAQPTPYVRTFSFTDYTANNPSTPPPGVRLDAEFNGIATTTDSIRANLALLQRDDGALRNAIVGPDQVSGDLVLGLRSFADWASGASIVVRDATFVGSKVYRALVSHTSGATFAADLAAGKWQLVADFAALAQVAVANAAVGTIEIDSSSITALLAAKAGLAANQTLTGINTFGVAPRIQAGTATTAADYLDAKPTDFGAGHPGVFLRKGAAATAWSLAVDDGAGGDGALDLVGDILVNGAPAATAADVAGFNTSVRRARNLALTRR